MDFYIHEVNQKDDGLLENGLSERGQFYANRSHQHASHTMRQHVQIGRQHV